MPIFTLVCNKCGAARRTVEKDIESIPPNKFICRCKGDMTLAVTGPSTQIMERLDNGSMSKAVERYHNAEELMQERHLNADPRAGTANRS